jgi:hypothetical protein
LNANLNKRGDNYVETLRQSETSKSAMEVANSADIVSVYEFEADQHHCKES